MEASALAKVVEGASLTDQSGTDRVSNQGSQVGRHNAHLVGQVGGELLSELGKFDHPLREVDNVDHVDGTAIHSGHDYRVGHLFVADDFNESRQLVGASRGIALAGGFAPLDCVTQSVRLSCTKAAHRAYM